MQELEKILEEIDETIERYGENPYIDEKVTDLCYGLIIAKDIIRKHMNDGWIPVDKNNVPDHEILACDRYENELIGYLSYNADTEEFVCESDECIMYQVIAWMEKPEPYRPERSDNHDGE